MENRLEFNPLWCIEETSFNDKTNKHFEGVFTQGNGYMSMRGSFEEGLQEAFQNEEYMRQINGTESENPSHLLSKCGTFIPGIFGKHPTLNEVIINLPYMLDMHFELDGEKLDMQKSSISNYKRWIDLRDGSLWRKFIWNASNGSKIEFEFHRFISMNNLHISIQTVDINVLSGNGEITFKSGITGNVKTSGYNHFDFITTNQIENNFISMDTLTNNGNKVFQSSYLDLPESLDKKMIEEENYIYNTCSWKLKSLKFKVIKYNVISTNRDLDYIEVDSQSFKINAIKNLNKVIENGFENEYLKHCHEWNEKWDISDIQIYGDNKAQLAVRFSIYHLIRSNASQDPRVAICPKGHAGEIYSGRYFWDTEIYMLPFFIYTNPQAAKNLLMFRYNSLKGAKENAQKYGYCGAKYPWESSINGVENCFVGHHCDNEIHITADVAYAIWHYYKSTNDIDFMYNYGIEILIETSKYWAQRVDKKDDSSYTLINVCGPDEYKPYVTDNAYTNRMVKFNLEKTVKFINSMTNEEKEEIFNKFSIDESDVENFKNIALNMYFPIDNHNNLILQCADFYNYEDININEIWKDKNIPYAHFISQEKLYKSKNLKQADVLTLITLFRNEFTHEQIKIAYEYYEPITTHDSSLSPVIHAMIALWLKKDEEVNKFLQQALELDLNYESKGGAADGIHIANCGAVWQLMVFGFAGVKMDLELNDIIADPYLPKDWTRMKFKMVKNSIKYCIEISKNGYNITAS